MKDFIGQQLGNYHLLRLIGQGGFADVYLGEHIHLGTQAAIKVLQMRLVGSGMEQFRNEARIIAGLVHPNIIRVLDFGVEDGIPFLVMDYASNGTLRQRHPHGVRLSPQVILPYVMQAASALQYAHDNKLIHRDVKPENMLLGRNNEVLLSDFGLVLVAQSTGSRSMQEMAGTVPYMAPEQLRGQPRPASDQYSLGISVYDWLSGECPFSGSFIEIASQHMLKPPSPLRASVADIAPVLEQVVMKALAKDPQQRFPDIQSFALAFERASRADQAYLLALSQSQQPITLSEETVPMASSPAAPLKTPEQSSRPMYAYPATDEEYQRTYVMAPNPLSQPTQLHPAADSHATQVDSAQDQPTYVHPSAGQAGQFPATNMQMNQAAGSTPPGKAQQYMSDPGQQPPGMASQRREDKRRVSWLVLLSALVGLILIAAIALLLFAQGPGRNNGTHSSPAGATATATASSPGPGQTVPSSASPGASGTANPGGTSAPASNPSPTMAPAGNPSPTTAPTSSPTTGPTPSPTPSPTPLPPTATPATTTTTGP